VDKTPAVPFAHVWLELLALDGDIITLELDSSTSADLIDKSGLDYIVHMPDNRMRAVSYRCLRWQGWFTFTWRDVGLTRLSEWDRLWLDPDEWWKPNVHIICYHVDGTPIAAAAVKTKDVLAHLDKDSQVGNINGQDGHGFRYVYVRDLPRARTWIADGGESN
jgi:hypothetical protein